MVVLIIGFSLITTKQSLLLLGLDAFGTGEETTRGDVDFKEWAVVGAAGEGSGDAAALGVGEEVFECVLEEIGAGWTCKVEGAARAIVDTEDVVGGTNHVEVEVSTDLKVLFGGQLGDVVSGSEKTESEGIVLAPWFLFGRAYHLLFCGPPSETDGVLQFKVLELNQDFQEANGTGSVVVDTWSNRDRVRVTTNKQHIVGVSRFALSNDVVGETLFDDGVDAEFGANLLSILDPPKQFETELVGKSTRWDKTWLVENTAVENCSNHILKSWLDKYDGTCGLLTL